MNLRQLRDTRQLKACEAREVSWPQDEKLTRNRRGLAASGVKTKRHLVLDDRRIVGIGLSFASHVKA